MRIGIDIDDTISKTYEDNVEILRRHNYKEKDKYDFEPEEFEKFLDRHIEEIHEIMEPKEYVSEVLKYLHENNEIVIISSRKLSEEENTIKFMKKYDIPYDEMYLGVEDKGKLCRELKIDYIIDDLEDNLDSCNNYGIKCIKFGKNSKKYRSVKDWKEIEKIF